MTKILLEPVVYSPNAPSSLEQCDYVSWAIIAHQNRLEKGIPSESFDCMSRGEIKALAQTLVRDLPPTARAVFDHTEALQLSAGNIATTNPKLPIWEPSGQITLIGEAGYAGASTYADGLSSNFKMQHRFAKHCRTWAMGRAVLQLKREARERMEQALAGRPILHEERTIVGAVHWGNIVTLTGYTLFIIEVLGDITSRKTVEISRIVSGVLPRFAVFRSLPWCHRLAPRRRTVLAFVPWESSSNVSSQTSHA